MNKFLPKTKNNTSGFTLVELMVVITIIAILSVIGITIFTGAQKSARDGVRQQDIQAISKALEVNKVANTTTYQPLLPAQFVEGIPLDPLGSVRQYCVLSRTDTTTPVKPTAWGAACPTAIEAAGTTVAAIPTAGAVPANTTKSFRVCTLLENGTAPNIYCVSNQQ